LRVSVPMAAAQAYDTVYILLHALFNARVSDLDGPALKKALETSTVHTMVF
jgi:branched-chain amino acid transport system substrate-binding protein